MTAPETWVAVDVGGTKIRAARVEADGRLTDEATWPTPAGDGRAVLESIAAMIDERVGGRALQRVGIAMPGGIDPSNGRLLRSQNLPDLAALDVPGDLARRVVAPVSIDNDGTLAAIGERLQGAARDVDDLAVIAVGTGVGAGIITGGRPLRGARGLAGELADLPLLGDAFDPRQRAQGPLEHRLGAVGLLRRYRELSGDAASDVRTMLASVERDDAAARVADELVHGLALVVAAVRAVVDPGLVVLTGGIGAATDIAERVAEVAGELCDHELEVVRSELGDRASLVGAGALALGQVPGWVERGPSTTAV